MLQQGLHLRRETEAPGQSTEVQGFLAETIAREEKDALGGVPDRESEHPIEAIDRCCSPLAVGSQDDLGVRASGEAGAVVGLEDAPELLVVVDLTIKDDGETPTVAGHRLVAAREVDDGQPPEAEAHVPVFEQAIVVGTTMDQCSAHPTKDPEIHRLPVSVVEDAGDAAHVRTTLPVPSALRWGSWRRGSAGTSPGQRMPLTTPPTGWARGAIPGIEEMRTLPGRTRRRSAAGPDRCPCTEHESQ